ncbi:hypothetical protein IAT38_005787 [Cryptococcus sp. DSM 104549]
MNNKTQDPLGGQVHPAHTETLRTPASPIIYKIATGVDSGTVKPATTPGTSPSAVSGKGGTVSGKGGTDIMPPKSIRTASAGLRGKSFAQLRTLMRGGPTVKPRSVLKVDTSKDKKLLEGLMKENKRPLASFAVPPRAQTERGYHRTAYLTDLFPDDLRSLRLVGRPCITPAVPNAVKELVFNPHFSSVMTMRLDKVFGLVNVKLNKAARARLADSKLEKYDHLAVVFHTPHPKRRTKADDYLKHQGEVLMAGSASSSALLSLRELSFLSETTGEHDDPGDDLFSSSRSGMIRAICRMSKPLHCHHAAYVSTQDPAFKTGDLPSLVFADSFSPRVVYCRATYDYEGGSPAEKVPVATYGSEMDLDCGGLGDLGDAVRKMRRIIMTWHPEASTRAQFEKLPKPIDDVVYSKRSSTWWTFCWGVPEDWVLMVSSDQAEEDLEASGLAEAGGIEDQLAGHDAQEIEAATVRTGADELGAATKRGCEGHDAGFKGHKRIKLEIESFSADLDKIPSAPHVSVTVKTVENNDEAAVDEVHVDGAGHRGAEDGGEGLEQEPDLKTMRLKAWPHTQDYQPSDPRLRNLQQTLTARLHSKLPAELHRRVRVQIREAVPGEKYRLRFL